MDQVRDWALVACSVVSAFAPITGVLALAPGGGLAVVGAELRGAWRVVVLVLAGALCAVGVGLLAGFAAETALDAATGVPAQPAQSPAPTDSPTGR